jgi:cytochrome b561
MHWLTTITVIVILVLAFTTGRALRKPARKGDRAA